jgi:Mg-chelatase subunit ChlD
MARSSGGNAAFAILATVMIALVANSSGQAVAYNTETTTSTTTTRPPTTRRTTTTVRQPSTTRPTNTTVRPPPPPTTSPTPAPKRCAGKADILFILDCSSSIGARNYEFLLNFTAEVTTSFEIGQDAVQFSALVYSSRTYKEFGFTDYLTNDAVKQAFLRLPYYGGSTFTGAALKYARTTGFSSKNDARNDVPHIAVVVTDGQSSDVHDTEDQAYLLKKAGVAVFSVGVGNGADRDELLRIATYPSFVFQVNDFSILPVIKSQLSTAVCEEVINSTVFCPRINDNGCVGRANGNYRANSQECQEGYYYSCVSEYAYKMPCALGWYTTTNGTRYTARMVYNDRTDKCELQADYCPRDPLQYKVDPPAQNNQKPLNTERPCLSSWDSCAGRPDGNYARCYPTCQDGFYVSCSNNEAYIMPCALGYYTDRQNNAYLAKMVYVSETDSCELTSTSCPRSVRNYDESPTPSPQNGSEEVTPQCHGQADILLIIDSSGSIGEQNYQIMLFFLAQLSTYFQVGPQAFQFSIILFSSDIYSLFPFNFHNNSGVYTALLNAPYLGMGTNTDLALAIARTYSFSPLNGARDRVGQVAVVVTDGISNYPENTADQASLLKAAGVTVVSVGVGPGADFTELSAIASYDDLVFEVDNFNVFKAIKKSLVQSTCESANSADTSCISNSCIRRPNGNYQACKEECKEGHYYSCSNGYAYKLTCPLGLYDASDNTRFYARQVYNGATGICEREVDYCPRNTSDYAEVPPPGFGREHNYNPTCISELSSCKGRRDGNYPKCFPECGDGFYYSCSNNETYTMPCADGWYTDKNNRRYTKKMIYEPSKDSCELEANYCPRDNTNNNNNNPPAPESPTEISRCTSKSDILLIMDSSDSIGEVNFAIQTAFLANLTAHFTIGPDAVQFSAIDFSTTAKLVFSFSNYTDNNAVWQAILALPYYAEGTNTAEALRLATDVAFTPANGARHNAPKNAIVITDGVSRDPPATAQEADRLKRSGVNVIVVGIGGSVRHSELTTIASSPNHVFNVTSFDALTAIAGRLIKSTCPGSEGEPSCVSSTCGESRVDGSYEACGELCKNGTFFVCNGGHTYRMLCPVMWYQDSEGKNFLAPGVYDPEVRNCQAATHSCQRNPADYRRQN